MKGLLKEEFYKSTRGVTQYICCAVAAFALIIMGLILSDFDVPWNDYYAQSVFYAQSGDIVLVLVMVFICGEFTRGSIRAYCEVGVSREKIFFAKLIKVAVISVGIVFAVQLLSLLVLPFVLAGASASFVPNLTIFLYSLLCLVENICFYVGMAFLIRNIGAMIGIYLGISLLYNLVYLLSYNSFFAPLSEFFNYSYFDAQITTAEALQTLNTMDTILAIAFPIVISVLSLAAGYFTFKKRNIT